MKKNSISNQVTNCVKCRTLSCLISTGYFSLFLDITDIIATSTDFDELTYVWSEWRKVASKPMRDDYKEYVRLENKAAEANGNF